jgi:TP901 family phage tail tape measure protein
MSSVQGIRAGRAFVELFTDNSRLVRGLKRAEQSVRAFGSRIQGIGLRMAGMTAAVAMPAALSLKTFAGFQDEMAKVQAVTGAAQAEFQSLYETAKQLGATTSFTASQVAEGMKYLGMAGFETREILAGIPGVLNLARAGAVDLGMAADIASDVGSAFGLAADQIGRISDVMAKTQASANTNIEMMGESLKYAAPIASTAGQSLEMTAAAIGVLGNNGIKATMAGTDLARILTNIAQTAVQEKLAAIGVQAADAAGNIRPLNEVMKDLGRATAGMSQSKRLSFYDDLFERAKKSALKLSEQTGDLDSLHEKLLKSQGAAAEMAATMENTLGGSMRQLLSAVESVQIAFGEALTGEIRKAAGGLTSFARQVAWLIDRNQSLVVSIAKGILIFGAAGVALLGLGLVIKGLAAGIGGVLLPIRMLGGLLGAAVSVFTALLSPVALVTAALVGVGGVMLYTSGLGGKALGWLAERFGSLKQDALAAYEGIADALAAGDIALAARVLWAGLKMEFQKGYAWVMQGWLAVKTFLLKTIQGAIDGAAAAWTIFTSWMRTAWAKTVGFLQTAWARFSAQFERATTRTGSMLAGWWLKIQESMAASPQEAERYRQAQQQLPQQTEAMLSKTSRDEAQRLEQINATQQAELDRINAERDARLASIGQDYEGVAKALDQQRQSDIAALQTDLDRAKADFQSAIQAARSKRTQKNNDVAGPTAPEGVLGKLKKQVEEALSGLDTSARTIGVKGTFNSAALRGLEAGDAASRIAKATEETARQTKTLVDMARRSDGLTFE